ncbi:MAG: fumarylacetoacetase [Myxococcota bacterium]|nr:fumarylacetoacetase [Myxococcota bacterium]
MSERAEKNTSALDESHTRQRRARVESANQPDHGFPIQNLPWCVVEGANGLRRGVRIGDDFFDLGLAAEAGLLDEIEGAPRAILAGGGRLSAELLSLSLAGRRALRARLVELLDAADPRGVGAQVDGCLSPLDPSKLRRPIDIGDYTDFYASVHHATNVGSMFRPDNPLLPNYKWIPVGYHGRASSVVVSDTEIRRPWGQQAPASAGEAPSFAPSQRLDYELEMGLVIGAGNSLGETVKISEAEAHIFGFCLLNDWSARDLQKWEYQPLGPFLAKNFATTISPYIVTLEALAPFRCEAEPRPEGDPQPHSHLYSDENQARGGVSVQLEVYLQSAQMRAAGLAPHRLSEGDFSAMYWTPAQMVTHHSASGCNLNPGDLLGSGTVSGPARGNRGCLLELTWDGGAGDPKPGTARTPIELPSGEKRVFLQDGDEVILRGRCHRDGFAPISFGECRGVISAAEQRA